MKIIRYKPGLYSTLFLSVAIALCATACGGSESTGDLPECERWLLVDDVTNARDLGGHELAEGVATECRKIIRGGDLSGLVQASCTEFGDLGIATVVDLRMESTQQSQPPAACVSANVVDAAMPKLLPDTPENYIALLDEHIAIASLFGALDEAIEFPVYVHCVIGRDRASFATALIMLALGAGHETILDEFELSSEAGVTVKPDCMQALLEEIDARGGISQVLTAAGVSEDQLANLRDAVLIE